QLVEGCLPRSIRPGSRDIVLPTRERARRTAAGHRCGNAARVSTDQVLGFAALRGLIPGVDVGAVEKDAELTPVLAREAKCRIEVDTVGLELRKVDERLDAEVDRADRKSTRLNSSH